MGKEIIIVENQKAKSKNAQKYFLQPDTVYGNYKTIREVTIQGSKSLETRWECIHIPTNEIRYRKPSDLAQYLTGTEMDKINEDLVKNNKHQMGFRNYLFRSSKANAASRNHGFNLSFEEFDNIIQQDCYYCGEKPRPATEKQLKERGNTKQPTFYYNGIDRIDSTKDYSVDNCVPCCPVCNYMKHTLSQNDFYNQIIKIYKHRNLDVASTTIPEGSTSQANGGGNEEDLKNI